MGPDDLVLRYPWFAATNAQPDWATGTLPASVTIHTKGAASGKPIALGAGCRNENYSSKRAITQ